MPCCGSTCKTAVDPRFCAKQNHSHGLQPQTVRMPKMNAGSLLLPGALLVTMQTELLPSFMLVDFCLAAFFE